MPFYAQEGFILTVFIKKFLLHMFYPLSLPFAWLFCSKYTIQNHNFGYSTGIPNSHRIGLYELPAGNSLLFAMIMYEIFIDTDLNLFSEVMFAALLVACHRFMIAWKWATMSIEFLALSEVKFVPKAILNALNILATADANEWVVRMELMRARTRADISNKNFFLLHNPLICGCDAPTQATGDIVQNRLEPALHTGKTEQDGKPAIAVADDMNEEVDDYDTNDVSPCLAQSLSLRHISHVHVACDGFRPTARL
jgi:hypothetical protein